MIGYLVMHYLRLYLRSAALTVGVGGFSILLVVVASLSFRTIGMTEQMRINATPGMIWLVLLFSLTMLLHFAAQLDSENGLQSGFSASPVDGGSFFIGKLLATVILAAAMNFLILIAHQVFFGVSFAGMLWSIFASVMLFSLGYLSLGILLSHISSRVPGREVLFPLIAFPMAIPAVTSAVSLTRIVLTGESFTWNSVSLAVLLCFAAVSAAVSWLLFDEVLKA